MSENFGLKIGLEGEREFKKSLAEINNSFRVLGSEMKLVDSQFDKNDKSAEALTARNQVLNKEIEQQKQKIETLRSALANAAESFGENDRRTQSWQIQLNNAQAALNGMERELNSNNTALGKAGKGFAEAGDESKDFSDSVRKAADTSEDADGKLSRLGDTAKKIGAALGAAAAAVGTACVAAGKKLWDMANDVGSVGDQIDKTSQKIGISAESYQKWGYVFERCGADVNNLQTGMKKLSTVITDAAGGSDSAAEKLSAVGLSIEKLNGKSQDEQLSMVITALQGMEAGAERTAAANDLLGKSAVDMAAVLNTSVEETERLKQEAEDYGMVMSNEAVAASAAFEDSLTRLSHTAGGLKNRMVGELLPGITQITDGLADLLAGNEQAAEELKNGVTSVIDTIRTLIPQFAEIITSIAGAVLESAPGIIKALADGLLSAISELTPTLAKIVTEIISALVGLLPQIVSAGADILLSLIKGIAETIPQLVPQIVTVVVEIVKTLVDNLPLILDAALQLVTGLAQGILDSLPILIEALPQIIMGIVDFLIVAIPQIIEAGIQLLTALVTALPDIIAAIVEVIPQIIDGIIKAVISAIPLIIEAGIKLLISLASYAQEESRSASENQKWRIKRSFESGIPWDRTLMGYRMENEHYVIVPREAEIVRRIYNEYLSGSGYQLIAKRLNEEGVPSRFGGKWNQSAVSRILSNHTYTGNLLLQKTFRENHITKRKIFNNGELPKYLAEESHEAIVDEKTFQAVQEEKSRRAARFNKKSVPKKTYPFSSLMVCDNCGKNYRRKITKTGAVWVCGTYNSLGKAACASKQIPESTLQQVTADVLGQNDFTHEWLCHRIQHIRVCNDNTLIFYFKDGSEITRIWKDRSRSQSWTDEMKEAARQKTLERSKHNA